MNLVELHFLNMYCNIFPLKNLINMFGRLCRIIKIAEKYYNGDH
uniref:Uncharacterized protein n=1 Tax=Anguilla anguilla TaxID=7936 RepID=A0A0E9XCZ2_ANGAN